MTRFFIDNQEIAVPFEIYSINEILKHVEGTHLLPNAVVRQIRVDGLPLISVPEEKSDLLYGIEKRDRVEIFTGTIAEIARDSIADALEYLNRVEAAIPSLGVSFQGTPGPEAFEKLKQLYEGLYWLNILLDKLKVNFHISLENVLIQGTAASTHNQKLISVLKQLIESQEQGDFNLIADLLEYEILPFVPIWREMFTNVSEKVNAAQ
jgi:hypothetical protein